MAFLGNIVKSFLSSEAPPPDVVIEINVSQYSYFQVICREGCLVLYESKNPKKYDLLLQKPLEDCNKKAFSIYRTHDLSEAEAMFVTLKDVLLPLMTLRCREIGNVQSLQKICNVMKAYPTYTVAHLASELCYSWAFVYNEVSVYVNVPEGSAGLTPLHIALKRKDRALIKALLDIGATTDAADIDGNSSFHLAAVTESAIIELLLPASSKLLNAQNKDGKTPLHLACENDKPECVKALLCAGADVNIAATHRGSYPVHSAAANSLLSCKEIIQMYPEQLNVEDMKQGGTPLHWATTPLMIKALLELGCNIDALNFSGKSALHIKVEQNVLPCVIVLLSFGADVNSLDKEGHSPAHFATSPSVLQALLVFGADLSLLNHQNVSVRHVIATSHFPEKNYLMYIVHSLGASRCSIQTASCTDGCSPQGCFDGVPPDKVVMSRVRKGYDEYLDVAMNSIMKDNFASHRRSPSSCSGDRSRLLSLDGGGMRGLILIQLLIAVEEKAGKPASELFDWIAGTSTGAILALSLALKKSARCAQSMYFRMKDDVFVGSRPYKEKPLEEMLKREFGENTFMSDLMGPKVIVTGLLADRFPPDLHLFRNYTSGEEILQLHPGNNMFSQTQSPRKQLVWQAARASGAAPSYFKASGSFIDGGLASNNPALDLLTEIGEYNTVLHSVGRSAEVVQPGILVSLGTGKVPLSKVDSVDIFRPESFFGSLHMVFGISNLASLLIEQATSSDNQVVDRCRAWCSSAGVAYFRLSPQLTVNVPLDETKDDVLVNMLWETMVYIRSKDRVIQEFVNCLLR